MSDKTMPEITQSIECTLPGFEGVQILYDLMATPEQVNNFIRQLGGSGSHTGVIVAVEGWDKEQYGPDPWDGARVPSIWLSWISMFAQKGYEMALRPPEANAKNDKTSRNGHSCKPSSL